MSVRSETLSVDELNRRFRINDGKLYWRYLTSGTRATNGEVGWSSRGYRRVRINGRTYFLHRVVWAMTHGQWPVGEIDHINGDKSDNRVENLRVVSRSQNLLNRGATCRNTSGRKGVSWHKGLSKWTAQIRVNYRLRHLGCFNDLDAASSAYNSALTAAQLQLNIRKV